MEEIVYIGERIWPGILGNISIISSFVFSLLSCITYFLYFKKSQASYLTIARVGFRIHTISVFSSVFLLLYMFSQHMFEYHYVWQHTNSEMPLKYIFAAFWEGQEGSFLLWIFWNALLGNILIKTTKNMEAPVMMFFVSIQVFLSSMLLGIYLGDVNIGSNPFTILLREHSDFIKAPIFTNPSYLLQLDGRGLNPLLQNYWMTIHPPTLFLGFSLTAIPFCYALASVVTQKFNEWVKPAISWTFLSIGVLGLGILMGGAWAYEALSFGGFWAWDPVENAVLVPWLTLVAGGHTLLVYKNKKSALFSTLFLLILSFIFILYSTFLTRSGILGDASVHSFTDLGLSGQLLIYLLFYIILSFILMVVYRKKLLINSTDEHVSSREFWMFIGSIILLISSIQIVFSTSFPVLNKILSLFPSIQSNVGKLAPPSDVIAHYHKFQVPIAILLAIGISAVQYLKYTQSNWREFFSKLSKPFIYSLLMTLILFVIFYNKHESIDVLNIILLWASVFGITANIFYFNAVFKNNFKKAASNIAHIGFVLILLGAVISQGQQQIISVNTSKVDVAGINKELKNQENILLYEKDTIPMGKYLVTYQGKKKEGVNILFQVDYLEKMKDGSSKLSFTLYPRVQTNPRMGNVSEPDTRHFLHKDIYTHVTYAVWGDLEHENHEGHDQEYLEEAKEHILHEGDTFFTSNAMVVLHSVEKTLDPQSLGLQENDIAVATVLNVADMKGNQFTIRPVFSVNPLNGKISNIPDLVDDLGLKFVFEKIQTEDFSFKILVYEKRSNFRDFIVMKAVVFPGINILWVGCVLMFIGTIISFWHRFKEAQKV